MLTDDGFTTRRKLRFFKTNRYGNFPSFSAAWCVSQEKFMKEPHPQPDDLTLVDEAGASSAMPTSALIGISPPTVIGDCAVRY